MPAEICMICTGAAFSLFPTLGGPARLPWALQANQEFKQQAVRMPLGASGGADPQAAASFERQDVVKQLWEKEYTWDQEPLDR